MTRFTSLSIRLSTGLLLCLAAGCSQRLEAPLSASAVPGQTLTDRERSVARNIFCKGEPVIVQDQASALTISSNCRVLTVAGNNNKITVDIQPRGRIEVTGSGNEVTWHLADFGPSPAIVNGGSGNKIVELRQNIGAP